MNEISLLVNIRLKKKTIGTSMASPHVAGLAAYYLSQEEGDNVDPQKIKNKIIQTSTRNVLSNIPKKTPNLLIFNGYDA